MPAQRKNVNAKKQKRSTAKKPFKRPVNRYGGKGAYFVQGGLHGSAKFGNLFNVGGQFNAGYSTGNMPSIAKGLGSYSIDQIKHNVLIKPDVPQIRNAVYAEGGTIIRHREYLGPIISSSVAGDFKIQTFPLNPAQATTFPWLSNIAENYETYRPNGILFEFRSTASDAIASSTNLALGQLMMCTQYDSTDPAFQNDVELLNYSWAQSGKVSDNVMHFVECDSAQSPLSKLYTRPAGLESDLRFSDFGKFSIASSGLQGTSVQIGQLWVSYEFILYKPKLGALQADAGSLFNYFQGDGSCTSTYIFGTLTTADVNPLNNLYIVLSYPTFGTNAITFPARNVAASYSVSVTLIGDSTASVTTPTAAVVGSGLSFIYSPYIFGSTVSKICLPTSTSTQTIQHIYFLVSIDGDGAAHSVNITVGATIVTNAECTVIVEEIPYIAP